MTREEAISNLNMISVAFVGPVTKEQRKLIDDTFGIAIQTLSQEPKTGHWIDNHNNTISCDYCHTWFKKDDRYGYMHYCPYCNTKMVESDLFERGVFDV